MNAGRAAIAALALLSLLGCGVKGALVKKGERLPTAPGAVRMQQQGRDILLSWSIPTLNQDGSELADLQRFVISRLPYRPGDYCDECQDTGSEAFQIYLDRPEPAVRVGERLFLRDADLPLESGYRYRIVPVNARDKAGAEAVTHQTLSSPPQPPTALQITAHERSLRLDWGTDPQQPEAGEWLGVNLYRATGTAPLPPVPINSEPVSASHYDDFNLDNGQEYRYGLRSVIRIGDRLVESPLSETIKATPRPEF